MGKISKYSNLYDKDCNFLHKPGNYSIEEFEELIDTLDKIETNLYKSLLSSLKQRLPKLKL